MASEDKVARYRGHAARLREMANETKSPETRALLEQMALNWDQIADEIEQPPL